MHAEPAWTRARRARARLATGRAAHLVGGALDLGGALGRHLGRRLLARVRSGRRRGGAQAA